MVNQDLSSQWLQDQTVVVVSEWERAFFAVGKPQNLWHPAPPLRILLQQIAQQCFTKRSLKNHLSIGYKQVNKDNSFHCCFGPAETKPRLQVFTNLCCNTANLWQVQKVFCSDKEHYLIVPICFSQLRILCCDDEDYLFHTQSFFILSVQII